MSLEFILSDWNESQRGFLSGTLTDCVVVLEQEGTEIDLTFRRFAWLDWGWVFWSHASQAYYLMHILYKHLQCMPSAKTVKVCTGLVASKFSAV